MTTFTDVFGSDTLPPSGFGYREISLTADTTLLWPYNTNSIDVAVAKIMDISCSAGVSVTAPAASLVSTGEDFLIRNIGANTLTVKKADGSALQSIVAGAAVYFFITDNTTSAGEWGTVAYGVGSCFVDAASLVGYGIKAIGGSLNQAHPTVSFGASVTLDSTYRSKLVNFIGGTATASLPTVASVNDDFFLMLRNSGTGTLTIDPAGVEQVDSQSTLSVQPGESLMLFCSGAAWFSVGHGRSTLYQFSQLVLDISAGGTFTLTASQASSKLITFVGNPASAVTVNVPPVASVYYLYHHGSTVQTVNFKTTAGAGVLIPQGGRVIALCDGVDVVTAQSVQATSNLSLIDGSSATPALNFASQTNTGLYKAGANGLGVAVNGGSVATFESAGIVTTTIGPTNTQRHTVPVVASDVIALLAAVQTFTNKTISSATNNVEARSLKSATTVVDVSTAAAPTAGQVLTALSSTTAGWTTSAPVIARSARTSNVILGTGDRGSLVDITSGTFNQSLSAAATLGAGWFVYIKNSSASDLVTLDPSGTETIDGRTTMRMYPGEEFLVQCNGTSFFTIGRQSILTLPAVTVSNVASISITDVFTDSEVQEYSLLWSLYSHTNSSPTLRVNWDMSNAAYAKDVTWNGTAVTTSLESGSAYIKMLPLAETLFGFTTYTTGVITCRLPNAADGDGHRPSAEIVVGNLWAGVACMHKFVDINDSAITFMNITPSVGTITGSYQLTLKR